MNFYHVLYVGIGGAIGSIARYLAIKGIDEKLHSPFPYGTLTVNVIGSVILGFILGLVMNRPDARDELRLFVGTGICGGFTTFSTFALENFFLVHQKPLTSAIYIGLSVLLGVTAGALGYWAGKSIG
jgi:fluoride exporter